MPYNMSIIEDDARLRDMLQCELEGRNYIVDAYESVEVFLERKGYVGTQAIISDLMLPGLSGIELIEALKDLGVGVPILVVSGQGSIPLAVEAVRKGALDFLEKPVSIETVLQYLEHYIQDKSRSSTQGFSEICCAGSSPMQEVISLLTPVAQSSATLFIHGETGTGKEVVARAVHNNSPRREANFVAINCGAIAPNLIASELFGVKRGAFTGADRDTPGKIKMSEGGTLFLDEIAELPLAAQSVLLRTLQERTIVAVGDYEEQNVDFRLIAATHKNLLHEVKAGRFREDLYYRINVFEVTLPALRNRTVDLPILTAILLKQSAEKLGVIEKVFHRRERDALARYSWPGNIRELRNVIERFLVTGRLGLQSLEQGEATPSEFSQSVESVVLNTKRKKHEKSGITSGQIVDALEKCRGNKSQAARLLDISRGAFVYHLQRALVGE
ncbi:MAG: sigma-54 dependent transcriptional regulator [Fibrobacterales bacterium]